MNYFKFLETCVPAPLFRVRFSDAPIGPGYEYWMYGLLRPKQLPAQTEIWSRASKKWTPCKVPVDEWEMSLYRWPVLGPTPLPSLEES